MAGLLAAPGRALGQLPAGWSDADVGAVGFPGSAAYSAGMWTITGSGDDIWNQADAFHYAFVDSTDSAVILAQVTAVQATDPWAKAGAMFRDSTDPSAMFAMAVVTPNNGVSFQWRSSYAGSCNYAQVAGVTAPLWVKLLRTGSDFSAFYSSDGASWIPIGPSQTVPMSTAASAGLCVCAHNNTLLNTSSFASVTVSNLPPPPGVVFGAFRQLWTGLNSSVGNTLDALTNTSYNPNWPDNPTPGYTRVYSSFEADANTGMSDYGQRMRAFIVPPVTGAYTFWIASDDTSELFLSTDEDPAAKAPIAWVTTWTNPREWTKEPNQQSVPVQLQAGRRYYLEAIMQQGGGGDNLSARWQLPDGRIEEPLPSNSSIGTRLIPCTGLDVRPGIGMQPTNITVVEGLDASFYVLSTNQNPVSYQWYVNGVPLTGANSTFPVYTLSNVSIPLNNNQVFTCVVSNLAGIVTSSGATLTVIRDVVPPTVLRAMNIGTNNVQVVYSKLIEPASGTNTANYAFASGVPVLGATMGSDGSSVILNVGPLAYGTNYTLVINGVRDRASVPNTIAANTRVSFVAAPYTSQDLGDPAIGSVTTLAGLNGLNVTAQGSDLGGYADQGSFNFTVRIGDFDIGARLAGLSASDVWAKAALMARETLDPNARFAAAVATPAMTGSFFEWRDPVGNLASFTGSFPINYPDTWLRLKRAGNTFTGYASYDGQNWSQLGSAIIAMPSQVYFGLALSSRSTNLVAQAQFRDIQDLTNTASGTISSPHEPLGPCSRNTPLVISEIMYKPAPRADTNNLEFLELYNSNPWFQDISGYRIVADAMSYTVPPGTILGGGGFLVIAASPQSIKSVYGISNVLGPYTGSLKKSGTIQLLNEQGAILLTIPYANVPPWPIAADGMGHSLVLANPTYGEGNPKAWDISDVVGGSPGQMDAFRPSPLRNVVINEFLAHTDPPDYDYIELYNHANQPVDISGCILTDDPATNKFVIPAGTVIPARGFVFYSETNMNFRLNAVGESIYFKNPDQSRYLDAVTFGGQENGVATGRWPDGAPDFYRLSAKTPGGPNAPILPADVVVNELMYDPISGNVDDEYVELYNRSTNAVNLGGWELIGGVSFTFPSNWVMAPDSYLVVAHNAAHLEANYANLNAANCLGDFGGKLSHNGEYPGFDEARDHRSDQQPRSRVHQPDADRGQ